MVKLIYQKFDGTDELVEVEYHTFEKAMFEAYCLHTSKTGQPVKIIDESGKVYGAVEILNYLRSKY